MLWLLMTIVLLGGVAVACWPFLRRPQLANGESAEIYKAQLSEIDREEAAGLMSADDARMARTEVQRRLISAEDGKPPIEAQEMTLTDRTTFIAVAASLAIGSAVLYAVTGSPGTVTSTHPPIMAQGPGGMPMASAATAGGGAQSGVAPVDEMMAGLESRLASQPNDVEGWRMLGWSKFRTNDYAGAATAYGKAVALAPDDAETQSAFGESLSRAAGGLVTDDAAKALEAALKADPAASCSASRKNRPASRPRRSTTGSPCWRPRRRARNGSTRCAGAWWSCPSPRASMWRHACRRRAQAARR
jgi:cytochrome c-type biogenesis protein CcmH